METSLKTIRYHKGKLIISINTNNPAATHELLLKGINDAVQTYLTHADKPADTSGITALMQLQKALIPAENELSKAYE